MTPVEAGTRPRVAGERETEILRYVAKGYAYREVADRLVISVRTVQNHVQHILRKLRLSSRYELMRFAMERGLDKEPPRRGPRPSTQGD